jgi:predicted nucleic acid-binding protein
MKNTIIDAGPLIALFDKKDKHHNSVKSFLKKYKGKLISTIPVLTETSYFLNFNVNAQLDFYKWILLGGLEIFPLKKDHLTRIIEITKKYENVPMDFADASLIILSEEQNIKEIISIDSDFDIYRTLRKEIVKNIYKN